MEDIWGLEKILQSLDPKFNNIVGTVEQAKDLNTMTVDCWPRWKSTSKGSTFGCPRWGRSRPYKQGLGVLLSEEHCKEVEVPSSADYANLLHLSAKYSPSAPSCTRLSRLFSPLQVFATTTIFSKKYCVLQIDDV